MSNENNYRPDDIPNALSGIGVFLLSPINGIWLVKKIHMESMVISSIIFCLAVYLTLRVGLEFVFWHERQSEE